MRRQSASDQLKQIDALFNTKTKSEVKVTDGQRDLKCNVHSRRRSSSETSNINGSIYNISNTWNTWNSIKPTQSTISKNDKVHRRQSFTEGYEQSMRDKNRKKNTWNTSIFGNIEHPSAFPSLLRSTSTQKGLDVIWNEPKSQNYANRRASLNSLSENRTKQQINILNKRNSFGSSLYLRPDSYGHTNLVRRDSFGSRNLNNLISDIQRRNNNEYLINDNQRRNSVPRDYVNQNQIKNLGIVTKSTVPVAETKTSILRKNSSISTSKNDEKTKYSKENLARHVTILESENQNKSNERRNDILNKTKRDFYGSSDDFLKSRRISVDSLDLRRSSIDITEREIGNLDLNNKQKNDNCRPHFVAVTTLEDVQAVRCAEFHPSGRIYAVGSNSKTFRICEYPSLSEVREEHTTYQPTVLFKRTKHHKGSIYCMGWAPDGEVVATGSNDKTIKLMRYDDIKKQLEGREIELTMHDGTIRDLCFLEDSTNKASLLISGGAGDCKIYVTDCGTATPFQALSGHGGHILSLYNWGGAMFVSGSQDKTIRFWDLRTRGCVNTITPATTPGSRQGSPVAAVCVDPSGRLLVSGHEDSSCVLYDIRGNRPIQCFKPHSADIRSIRFSPSAYYLLTAGYDNKLVLTDLQGDLTLPLPSVVVGHHTDKVISGRWHPTDFSFLSTSADKTATLWALPPL